MGFDYNPQRQRNLFDPASNKPFKLSRTRIDNFVNCPRCFYIDRRLGTDLPPGYPFSLNSAVDELLKKEFDLHRAEQTPHPIMVENKVDAVPFDHEKIDEWRENFKGVQVLHEKTNFILTGAVDDVWERPDGELIVVDYKATSKNGEVTLDADWQDGYKRQMEFYQWLMRKNGFKVSGTGYFVYCNGIKSKEKFDNCLDFTIKVIPYEGDDGWVEPTLEKIQSCLTSDTIPDAAEGCHYCGYREAAQNHELDSSPL